MDPEHTDSKMDDLEDEYSCTCKLCCYTCSFMCRKGTHHRSKAKKQKDPKKMKSLRPEQNSEASVPKGEARPKKGSRLKKARIAYEELEHKEHYLLKPGELGLPKTKVEDTEKGELCQPTECHAEQPAGGEFLTSFAEPGVFEHYECYKSETEDENLVKGEPCPEPVLIAAECSANLSTEDELLKDYSKEHEYCLEREHNPINQYNMNHKRRGHALIMLQSEIYPYIDPKYRGICTDHHVEADMLKTLFTSLGFDVAVKDFGACKGEMIQECLQKVAEDDHTDADCFICVILGHGGNDELYCTNMTLEAEELTTYFKGDVCLSLAGKPKLFFIQFCQGQEIALSQVVADSADAVVCDSSSCGATRIPAEADFMISLATVPGELSSSTSTSISSYVLALSEIISKNHEDMELLRMMTRINCAINNEKRYKETGSGEIQLEIPKIMTTMTKDLYFPSSVLTVEAPAIETVCIECDTEAERTEL